MKGPHLEPTPDYTPEGPTPSHSQSNLAQLHEVGHVRRTIENPSNVLDTENLRAMPTLARFFHLLCQSKALIEVHGSYTTFAGTTVFSRAPLARNHMTNASAKDIALSLAAAHDSVGSAQIEGPAKDDLAVFKCLWDTTVDMLESLIRNGDLNHETFGWGILGLGAGYIGHASWKEDSLFLAHKTRLHDALVQMPSMDAPVRRERLSLSSGGHVGVLAKANREIHVCDNLLLQRFQREEWKRIRWYHGVAVVQKWIAHLGMEPEIS
ncbi:hypothetical protein BKA63DRAFT_486375 [Paraphoma chrysanthemicola]|nr:hypothetical protein BKA63DRAFT_486375 [Paraphoma chrysanthemicola]